MGEVKDHLCLYRKYRRPGAAGQKVIEVRNDGVNKGSAANAGCSRAEYDFILGIGDDWTDEDLFAVMPEKAYTIKIGLTSTRARFTLRDSREAVGLLNSLTKAVNGVAKAERVDQTGL